MPPGSPPDALFYVLRFLMLKDLLSMERVCKSLREAVVSDVLLWQHLIVDSSVSKSFADEDMIRLASRGQGRLESLVLIHCTKITDDGLAQVVAANPFLSRLCLPGCLRISSGAVVGMVENLTKVKGQGSPGLKQLKIGGIYVTKENLKHLQSMLQMEGENTKRQFYLNGSDECRGIDVEACPKCDNVRVIYDCTRDRCQHKNPKCRACKFCIARCEDCGMCIDDTDYEETFCLRIVCSSCLPKASEMRM